MSNVIPYISENAHKILTEKQYYRNGETNWGDMADRVSVAIAAAEVDDEKRIQVQKETNEALKQLEFLFSSPCLLNANIDNPGQLSSCFVLGVDDNIESICRTDAHFAKIFQRNGGAGTDVSVLRPAKSKVENTNGYSCGPIGFMKKFNSTADIMTENNPTKRGALKINLSVWHPNIIDFIQCKDKDGDLGLMNISVSIYDDFMWAALNDEDWNLEFPDLAFNKEIYNKEWDGDLYLWKSKGYPTVIYKTMKAKELLDLICEHAWKTGEPGVNFQDIMNRANKNPHLGRQVRTNPCNEFANLIYTSCNLGSINLAKMVAEGKMDWVKFRKYVKNAIRWIDNMITVNKLPLPEIHDMTMKVRPVGLGIMAFADLLYMLRIPYNSEEGYDFAEKLIIEMKEDAIEASMELAIERGEYPAWRGSWWEQEAIKVRNCNMLSIAPNGTLASIADVSGGIEPYFALVYQRRTASGQIYFFVCPTFKQELIDRGLYSDALIEKIFKNHGSVQGLSEIPEDMQRIYVTSHDVKPMEHIEMLARFQKHVDLSISKTVNFLNHVKVDDIKEVIVAAFHKGIKGLTVYRDGCRSNQTLTTGSSYEDTEKKEEKKVLSRKEMGKRLEGGTYYAESACGKFYLTINRDSNGKIVETFINFKQGLCKSNIDAVNRLISFSLRRGATEEEVAEQLRGISCSACSRVMNRKEKEIDGLSCPDIIARLITEEGKKVKGLLPTQVTPAPVTNVETVVPEVIIDEPCPDCGMPLTHGQCVECKNCGYSKCGA